MEDTDLALPARAVRALCPGMNHLNMLRVCDALGFARSGYGNERHLVLYQALAIVLAWRLHLEQELPIPVAGEIAASVIPDAWRLPLEAFQAGSDAGHWLVIDRRVGTVHVMDRSGLTGLFANNLLEGLGLQPLRSIVANVREVARKPSSRRRTRWAQRAKQRVPAA